MSRGLIVVLLLVVASDRWSDKRTAGPGARIVACGENGLFGRPPTDDLGEDAHARVGPRRKRWGRRGKIRKWDVGDIGTPEVEVGEFRLDALGDGREDLVDKVILPMSAESFQKHRVMMTDQEDIAALVSSRLEELRLDHSRRIDSVDLTRLDPDAPITHSVGNSVPEACKECLLRLWSK